MTAPHIVDVARVASEINARDFGREHAAEGDTEMWADGAVERLQSWAGGGAAAEMVTCSTVPRARRGRGNVTFVTSDAPATSEVPNISGKSAYPFLVWSPVRLGVACAGIVAMLATSGCSGSDPEPDAITSPDIVTMSATPSPNEVDPTIPTTTSQAAGIPTAAPSPATTPDPTTLNASVLITLATVDPDTGGMLLGGYVSGVMEDGGDCQYIVTSSASGSSLTIHKDGVENNGTTSCGSTTVSPSRVPAGSYMVLLRYVNEIGAVASDAVEVKVP